MQNKLLIASVMAATAMFTVAGCSSNQAVKTTDETHHHYGRQTAGG